MPLPLRIDPGDASLIEVLERILDGCIAFEPSVRLSLGSADLSTNKTSVVASPDRRSKPFLIPKNPPKTS